MDLTAVLAVAFAVAFLVSVLDYFLDLGIWRAAVAVVLSAIGTWILGVGWPQDVLCALSAAFLAMASLTVIERINFRPGRAR